MEPSYSLAYYLNILGGRTGAFVELVEALADELEDYALTAAGPLSRGGDPGALGRLRHSHRPLVLNLKLDRLAVLEDEARRAVAEGLPDQDLGVLAGRIAAECQAVARALRDDARRTT